MIPPALLPLVHRATCCCHFIGIRQGDAGGLANIELDYGGHIVGDTVGTTLETILLCRAGILVLTWRQEITRAHDMEDKRLVSCLLNPQNTKRTAWCFQDSHLSAKLHCQWWGFHCGRLCKKHSSTSSTIFNHGPSNSTRVKHS